MPTFDFECQACGNVFEATIPFGARAFPRCTKCGGKTRKRIAPPTIHFKGSGFYKTDSTARAAEASGKKEERSEQKDAEKPEKSGKQTPGNTPMTKDTK